MSAELCISTVSLGRERSVRRRFDGLDDLRRSNLGDSSSVRMILVDAMIRRLVTEGIRADVSRFGGLDWGDDTRRKLCHVNAPSFLPLVEDLAGDRGLIELLLVEEAMEGTGEFENGSASKLREPFRQKVESE